MGKAMDHQEIIITLIGLGLAALSTAVGVGIKVFKAYGDAWVTKIKVSTVNDEMFSVVGEVSQTLVPEIRKASADGKISQEEREHLRQVCVKKFQDRFGKEWIDDLKRRLGMGGEQFEDWLLGKVEAHVWRQKMEMKKAE